MFSKIWSSTAFVAAELLILSILIPSVIFFFKLAPYILFILWAILVYTILVYRYVGSRQEIVVKFDLRTVVVVVCRWIVATIILLILTYQVFPDKLFMIQENNPGLIWKILIFYPIFSALPQEFIFCKFLALFALICPDLKIISSCLSLNDQTGFSIVRCCVIAETPLAVSFFAK